MQRLKDLVPACHVSDATLRKLDVLKATADYIEVLHNALGQQCGSQGSIETLALDSPKLEKVTMGRRSVRPHSGKRYIESPTLSSSSSSVGEADHPYPHEPSGIYSESILEVDEVNAAESLIQIAESPMLGPVIERRRLTISELMHL